MPAESAGTVVIIAGLFSPAKSTDLDGELVRAEKAHLRR